MASIGVGIDARTSKMKCACRILSQYIPKALCSFYARPFAFRQDLLPARLLATSSLGVTKFLGHNLARRFDLISSVE
jgi:hypothetical protein